MGYYLSKRQRAVERALEAEIVRQEWLAKRRMGKKVTENKPQWQIEREGLLAEFKAAGENAMESVISVTKLLWPIISKSYGDVVKSYKPVYTSLLKRLRANNRAQSAWEAEQERAKDDSKDPGRTGQDAKKPARPDAAQFASDYHDPNR